MVGLTETFVSILVEAWGAALGADSVLEHVSIHAQQAVGAQGAPAGVAAPVALWETDGRVFNAQPGWMSSLGWRAQRINTSRDVQPVLCWQVASSQHLESWAKLLLIGCQ